MDTRTQLRSDLLARRRAITPAQQIKAANALLANLQSWSALKNLIQARSAGPHTLLVGVYLAVGGEINLATSIQWLQSSGAITALPIIRQQNEPGSLKFAPYSENTPLETGKYGIPHPVVPDDQLLNASQLDLVLVPLAGFDGHGNRLGMGGGYYDRTFSYRHHAANAGPNSGQLFVGVAHDLQKVNSIPAEPWDIPLDAAITDAGLYLFNQLRQPPRDG